MGVAAVIAVLAASWGKVNAQWGLMMRWSLSQLLIPMCKITVICSVTLPSVLKRLTKPCLPLIWKKSQLIWWMSKRTVITLSAVPLINL